MRWCSRWLLLFSIISKDREENLFPAFPEVKKNTSPLQIKQTKKDLHLLAPCARVHDHGWALHLYVRVRGHDCALHQPRDDLCRDRG